MPDSLAILILTIPAVSIGFAMGWSWRDRSTEIEVHDAYQMARNNMADILTQCIDERNVYQKLWRDEVIKNKALDGATK